MAESNSKPPPGDERPPLTPVDEGETFDGGGLPVSAPTAPISAFARGQILAGRFRIVRFVARGGMGEVYEAEDLELHEHVALKTVRFEMADNEHVIERFKREIQLARKVTHASVCRTFDVFRHPDPEQPGRDTLIVSMEFLRGETLSHRIALDGRLKTEFALPIVQQMAAGLEAAHAAGVIHRDFKSPNVILVPSSASPGGLRAVITDFGLAHGVTGNMASLTGSLDVVGTPAYMSPEQLEGKEITGATDTYALGVVMYEMLTGERPFAGGTVISTALKRLTEPAPSPRKIVQELDPQWEAVVMRCLERDPERRFATTLDVAKALQGEQVSAPAALPAARPSRKYLIPVAAAALAVVLGVGYFASRHRGDQQQSASRPTPASGKARTSVAILGFQNLSGRPDAALLGDVLTDSLWSQLDVEEIRFIPPSRVDEMRRDLGLKDVKQDPGKEELKRIGQYLGSDVIVTGSYRTEPQTGGKIDWNVRLMRIADGESLGSVQQAGSQSNVNELAARAGKLIRTKLGIELSTQELARLDSSFSANPDALQNFAQAREKLRSFDLREAVKLLGKSVTADPKFAQPHVELAGAWSELGFESRAQEEAKRALDLSTNMSTEGKGLVAGRYYETIHDWPKAMEQYASLWALYKDDPEYGLLLARSQVSAGKAAQALVTIDQVRKLQLPIQMAVQTDLLEADAQEGASSFDKQLTAATRAAEKAKSLNAKLLLARARIIQCGALLNAGKAGEAKPMCDEALQINRDEGDALGIARATNEVANAYWRLGDYAAAKPLYQQALDAAQTIGDKRDQAGALNNLANISDAQGDEAAAERGYQQSIAVAKERGSHSDLALAHQNLAVILYSEGKRKEGAVEFQQAIEIARQIGDRKTEARALNNRCGMQLTAGEVVAARQSCEQSLALRRQLEDQGDVARSLGTIGDVQLAQGELGAAEQSYREALRIEQQIDQKHDAAATQASLADWALKSGKMEDGVKVATDAAVEFGQEKDAASEAGVRITLAEIMLAQENQSGATTELEKARRLAESASDPTLKLRVAVLQARIDAQEGKAEQAIAALQSAEKDALKTGDVSLAIETRIALGEAQIRADKVSQGKAALTSAAQEAKSKGFGLLAKNASAAADMIASKIKNRIKPAARNI
jgi:serine/threonine protein kinase/tetratricopeptide (TPR) repeat protein